MTEQPVRLSRMVTFFIPLGISAVLVNFTHVIINSTLARAVNEPEKVVAAYAIALSIFFLTERAAALLRQTTSVMVHDQKSFYALARMAIYLLLFIYSFSLTIAFTPVGEVLFIRLFGAEAELLEHIIGSYRILILVTLFSLIRCVYHGIIVNHMRTKWLTIGMVVRLIFMYALALLYFQNPQWIDANTGAILFLSGMIIEAIVAFMEGHRLFRKMPKQSEKTRTTKEIFHFYRPMLISSFIIVSVSPLTNAMLGKTDGIELAIASFAIAFSVTQLIVSFFSYTHQIVINFYNRDRQMVYRFALMFCMIPAFVLALIAYTPLGAWLLQHFMAISGELLEHVIEVLRIFVVFAIVFPWCDFCNGLLMLRNQTGVMIWTQSFHVVATAVVLLLMLVFVPHWNGMIGAIALSCGTFAELTVLVIFLRYLLKLQGQARSLRRNA